MENGETNEEIFETPDTTGGRPSNFLEKGRYKVKVIDIFNSVKSPGWVTIKLETENGFKLTDSISNVQEGWKSTKYKQFFHAIGQRKQTKLTKDKIINSYCFADVTVDKEHTNQDGEPYPQNKVRAYSPIEEEIAPISGVEPEEPTSATVVEPEPVKEEPKEEDEDVENI